MALTGCCGCHNLKRGSIAIAITLIVLSGVGIVYDTGVLVHAASIGARLEKPPALIAVSYLIQFATIAFNALLILGVKRASRGLLLSWIVYHGIMFALTSLAVVGLLVYTVLASGADAQPMVVNMLALLTAGLAAFNVAEWYWFAVVVAHMNEIDDGTTGFGYSKHEDGLLPRQGLEKNMQ